MLHVLKPFLHRFILIANKLFKDWDKISSCKICVLKIISPILSKHMYAKVYTQILAYIHVKRKQILPESIIPPVKYNDSAGTIPGNHS